MRTKILILMACVTLAFGASPALAKPKPKPPAPTAFDGTTAGAGVSQPIGCAWDPETPSVFSGIHAGGWSFLDVQMASTAAVTSKALGRGSIAWSANIFAGGGKWIFSTADGKSAVFGFGNVNLGRPSFPYEGIVTGGSGRFASVNGGTIILDRPPFTPPGVCSGVDATMGGLWDTQYSWTAGTPRVDGQATATSANGWIAGYLTYG